MVLLYHWRFSSENWHASVISTTAGIPPVSMGRTALILLSRASGGLYSLLERVTVASANMYSGLCAYDSSFSTYTAAEDRQMIQTDDKPLVLRA